MGHLNDHDLFVLIKEGHEPALNELMNRYRSGLFHTALSKTGDKDAAFSMVQDIFMQLWRSEKDILIEDTLEPYLHTAIRNQVLKYYRQADISVNVEEFFCRSW